MNSELAGGCDEESSNVVISSYCLMQRRRFTRIYLCDQPAGETYILKHSFSMQYAGYNNWVMIYLT